MKQILAAIVLAIFSFSTLAETLVTIEDIDQGHGQHGSLKLDANGRVYLQWDNDDWWNDLGPLDKDAFEFLKANMFLFKTAYIETRVNESGTVCKKVPPRFYRKMLVGADADSKVILSNQDCTAMERQQPQNDYVKTAAQAVFNALLKHYFQNTK